MSTPSPPHPPTPKPGITIYRGGFPPDFAERTVARLARYWRFVNHSMVEAHKLPRAALYALHEEVHAEFRRGPLYAFPDPASPAAREAYFRVCEEACKGRKASPRDHVRCELAAMAAITVLQTQDLGEYMIQFGGLTGRDLMVRAKTLAQATPLRPEDFDAEGAAGAEPGDGGTLGDGGQLGDADFWGDIFGTAMDLSTPRQPPLAVPSPSPSPAPLPSASPALLPSNTSSAPNPPSPPAAAALPDTAAFIADLRAMHVLPHEPAMPLPNPTREPYMAPRASRGDWTPGPPPARVVVPPRFLGLIGRRFRAAGRGRGRGEGGEGGEEFVVQDCSITIVHGTRLYVLRVGDGERYVNEDGLAEVLERSVEVGGQGGSAA